LATQAVQYPFGEISVSPGISLQPPRLVGLVPGTNCVHPAQSLSPFGLSWYFSEVRNAAFVAASDLFVKASSGIATIVALPILTKWRRVEAI